MKYKVFEWDFVKQEGKVVLETNQKAKAIGKAREIAKGFCQDEKPLIYNIKGKAIIYDTDCDFGALIRVGKGD